MKRVFNTLLFTAVVILVSISCTKESVGESGAERLIFNASTAENSSSTTRTTLHGTKVFWELGDKVSLWYGTIGTEMTEADYYVGKVDASDGRRATLEGFAEESPAYMAVYPRSACSDCSKKGKLTVEIPIVQKAVEESFAPEANVAVAYSETTDLKFYNVGGLMALRVASAGGHRIKTIRFAGTAAIGGEVEIKQAGIAAGNPVVDAVTEGSNCITLDCGDGIEDLTGDYSVTERYGEEDGYWEADGGITLIGEAEGTKSYAGDATYYIVTLPGSHTGFTITLVDDENRAVTAKSTNPFTIERNGNTLIAKITAPTGEWAASPKVYINEIFCHEDRIELWNPNDFAVDLTGWLLVKDEKSWAFTVGSVIAAKGYKVITAGQEKCEDGPMFGISGDKGFVLSLVSGTEVDKIDNSGDDRKIIGATETFGRKTDGSDEWVVFSTGTIYEEGVCDGDNSKGVIKGDEPVPVIDYTGLVINEVNGNDYNADNGNDKFIELYNGSAGELDLAGVVMQKDGETVWTGAKDKHVLASGAYLLLYSEKSEGAKTCPAENIFSSGLSPKKAVRVQIFTPGGESIDDFNYATYSGTPAPASYGRNSGSGEWYYQSATPGAQNIDGTQKMTGLN